LITVPENATLDEVRFLLQRLANMVREIDSRNIDNIDGWSGNQTNVTTDRAFDADSTSTDELADVLGTLIADLITKGVIT
jgi:hypothetical protein